MYRTRQIRVRKGHKFHTYCTDLCTASAKLYNRGNYLIRQYASSVKRMENGEELTDNQQEAYDMIRSLTAGTKYEPKKTWLTYGQLDYILKTSEDPAYRALPAQANQQILKVIIRSYHSFFEAQKVYQKKPQSMTGRPKMPGYKKRGSRMTAVLTNQICTIKEGRYLKFPGTKEKLNIGKYEGVQNGEIKLKEVRIKSRADEYVIDVVLELEEQEECSRENPLLVMEEDNLKALLSRMEVCPYRVAAIDPGTSNFCAVTNNFGAQPFLVRGGLIKARNNFYNKELAHLKSEAKKCNDKNSTGRIDRLHAKRNRIMKDLMHKVSRRIVNWAEENKVDLVILGHNIFQKQEISLGHENNQTFVQIPFFVFAGMLKYKLKEKGIAFLETEEAYTSKADFLAKDPIPEYEKGKESPKMSGERIRRGLYRHYNGQLSNADINGAANILRKVFPNVKEWDKGVVDTPYAVRAA